MEEIRREIGSSLRLGGAIQIGSLNRKTILLRFTLEADCIHAWIQGRAMVAALTVWLSRWMLDLIANRDPPLSLVVEPEMMFAVDDEGRRRPRVVVEPLVEEGAAGN
nr:uncharacterized protein LOC109159462 [Ipomoea trifida]